MKIIALLLLGCFGSVLTFADTNGSEFIKNEFSETWHRIHIPEGKHVLLIAEEEAGFIRKQIGDWLPVIMLDVKGSYLDVAMNRLVRKNSKIEYIFTIRNSDGKMKQYHGGMTDYQGDASLPCVFYAGKDGHFFEIDCVTQNFGEEKPHKSPRRIMFRFDANMEGHAKNIRVSKAMGEYKWEEKTVWKF